MCNVGQKTVLFTFLVLLICSCNRGPSSEPAQLASSFIGSTYVAHDNIYPHGYRDTGGFIFEEANTRFGIAHMYNDSLKKAIYFLEKHLSYVGNYPKWKVLDAIEIDFDLSETIPIEWINLSCSNNSEQVTDRLIVLINGRSGKVLQAWLVDMTSYRFQTLKDIGGLECIDTRLGEG